MTNYIVKENLKNIFSLLIDEFRDTFHSNMTDKRASRGIGDTLDIVRKNLLVMFGTSFSRSRSFFSSSSHFDIVCRFMAWICPSRKLQDNSVRCSV